MLMAALNAEPQLSRRAFTEAARETEALVDRIRPNQWGVPALDRWNVRQLVGHVVWVMGAVERFLSRPASKVELPHAADYFLRSIRPGGQVGDPASIAALGVEAAKALGEDPPRAVRAAMGRTLGALARLPDDAVVKTYHGGMRLATYLPAPTLELTVHLLDLGAAMGEEVEPPEAARKVTLLMLAEFAMQPGKFAPAARALTGRGPGPRGFALLT